MALIHSVNHDIAKNILPQLATEYHHQMPKEIIQQNLHRIAYEHSLVFHNQGSYVDVGAGIGMLALACKLTGVDSVSIIEDFADPWHDSEATTDFTDVLKNHDVKIINGNALTLDWPIPDNSLDCVSSFDSLEHWPHSPAHLFGEIKRVLKPGGKFVLGAPNAVNILKRIRVVTGKTNLPKWKDFYEQTPWRGHIHEPTLSEFHEIMETLEFETVYTGGRNWLAYRSGYSNMKLQMVKTVIPLLNKFPTLCSDLYIVGRKPAI